MNYLKSVIVLFASVLMVQFATAQSKTKAKGTHKHATAAAYQCPMKCEGEKIYAKAGKCPVCKMNLKEVSTAATYQCPMKCEGGKTYVAAGKCPVCNMNLKEVATTAAYECPMKCEAGKSYAKEGKCPVCKMKLKAKQPQKKTTATA